MLKGSKLPVAMGQTPSRDTEAESAKREAYCPWYSTGVTAIRGSDHISDTRYNDVFKRSPVLQATPHTLGTYPVSWDIETTGCQGNKLTLLQLVREFQAICGGDKTS